jgi:glycosyltransferase involved in cell wall biosynthesis
LRIAIAGIHAHVTGGAESYLQELVPMLEAGGHEVTYGYQLRGGPGPPVARREIAVDLGRHAAQALLDLKADVVLQNSLVHPVDEIRLARSATPVCFFAHAYSGLCISGTRRFSRPVPTVCTRIFGAGCWTQYFNRGCGGASPVTAIRLFRENRLRLEAMKAAAGVIVASDHLRELVIAHGVRAERVFKVPLFVHEVVPSTSASQRLEGKQLIYVGRITRLKGWPEMLEAFGLFLRNNPGWRLNVVGDGNDMAELRSTVAARGLPVTVHPWQDERGRDTLLDSAALLILPSTWPEPFGRVGLEAARLGVPTVAFDVGGVREWLIDGQTGRLVTAGSSSALALAIAQSVSDVATYSRMAGEARLHSARFGAERHVSALEAVLTRLAKH